MVLPPRVFQRHAGSRVLIRLLGWITLFLFLAGAAGAASPLRPDSVPWFARGLPAWALAANGDSRVAAGEPLPARPFPPRQGAQAAPQVAGALRFGGRAGSDRGHRQVEFSLGGEYLEDHLAVRGQGSALIMTPDFGTGLRLDGAVVAGAQRLELARFAFSLGRRLGSSDYLTLGGGILHRYERGDFPTVGEAGEHLTQYAAGLEWLHRFIDPPPSPAAGGLALAGFLEANYYLVSSRLAGQLVEPGDAQGDYLLEYGFGGGRQYQARAGILVDYRPFSLRLAGGVRHRSFEDFLDHPGEDETQPTASLRLGLRDLWGLQAVGWFSWDPDQALYGAELSRPLQGDLAIYARFERSERSELPVDQRWFLGLRWGGAPLAAGGVPPAGEGPWLRPAPGVTTETIQVLRPLWRRSRVSQPGSPPGFEAIPDQTASQGQAYQLDLAAFARDNGQAISLYQVQGLPPGLFLNTTRGLITGSPEQEGTFPVQVRARNSLGWGDWNGFSLEVSSRQPHFGPIPDSTTAVGDDFSLELGRLVIDGGNPVVEYQAQGLPPGLSLDSTSGRISGKPASAGEFAVKVRARNLYGFSGWQGFTITVSQDSPYFDPIPDQQAQINSTFQLDLSRYARALLAASVRAQAAVSAIDEYQAVNLPPGLDLDSTSGLISGTPSAAGTYRVRVRARNHAGFSGWQGFILQVNDSAIFFHDIPDQTARQELPFRLNLAAYVDDSGTAVTGYQARGLEPLGLALSQDGVISGSPPREGEFPVEVRAGHSGGWSPWKGFNITVSGSQPWFDSIPDQTAKQDGSFQLRLAGYLHDNGLAITGYKAQGLPAGLDLDQQGVISGSPSQGGEFVIKVAARNSAGWSGWQSFTLKVSDSTPYFDPIPDQNAKQGTSFQLRLAGYLHDNGLPVTGYKASDLPPGLSLDSSSGLISGQPGQSGQFHVRVAARNHAGWGGWQGFTITVSGREPYFEAIPDQTGRQDQAFFLRLYTFVHDNGLPITGYKAQGLEAAGLSLSQSGEISGTPPQAGKFALKVAARNSAGWSGWRGFTLEVSSSAPYFDDIPDRSLKKGEVFSLELSAYAHGNGLAITGYKAQGLPPGLYLDSSSGRIAGRTEQAGTYQVKVAACNQAGWSGWQGFTITVNQEVPHWKSIPPQTAEVGSSFRLDLSQYALSEGSPITAYQSSPLPQGLILDSSSGIISGVPAPHQASDWDVSLRARNAAGWSGPAQLSIHLHQVEPPANPGLSINGGASYTNQTAVSLALHADNMSSQDSMRITYTGGGDTGWIAYATSRRLTLLNSDGPNTVSVTYRNSAGRATAQASITVYTTPPTVQVVSAESVKACGGWQRAALLQFSPGDRPLPSSLYGWSIKDATGKLLGVKVYSLGMNNLYAVSTHLMSGTTYFSPWQLYYDGQSTRDLAGNRLNLGAGAVSGGSGAIEKCQ